MFSREQQLRIALEAALEYIDAIPTAAASAFPAMPGFDRDDVDELLATIKADERASKAPVVAVLDQSGSMTTQPAQKPAHFIFTDGDECPRMIPEAHLARITLEAIIGYPGSRVSDLLIGGHKAQIPNADLLAAISTVEAQ